jgi:hypothetical protein
MEKKITFLDAIKKAQQVKTKMPTATTTKVQEAKFKTQVSNNRPTKRASGRGG